MFLIYAKIGTILVIVLLEIVAYICTIDQITRQGGSYRKILKSRKERDGKESIILSLPKNRIERSYSKLFKSTNHRNFAINAMNVLKILFRWNVVIYSALLAP
jgi:hypothetical protein